MDIDSMEPDKIQANSRKEVYNAGAILTANHDTLINSASGHVDISLGVCDSPGSQTSQIYGQTIARADCYSLKSLAAGINTDQQTAKQSSNSTTLNSRNQEEYHEAGVDSILNTNEANAPLENAKENYNESIVDIQMARTQTQQNRPQVHCEVLDVSSTHGIEYVNVSANSSNNNMIAQAECNDVDNFNGDHLPPSSPNTYDQPPEEVSHEVDISASHDGSNNDSNPIQLARADRIVELLPNPGANDDDSVNEENDWVIGEEFYDLDIFDDIPDYGDVLNGYQEAFEQFAMEQGMNAHGEELDDEDDYEDDDDESFDDPLDTNNSDDDMEEVSETDGENGQQRNINYDTSLPARHNYLGENLEELVGRQILDEQALTRLPIFEIDQIILLPGQLLPMNTNTLRPHVVDHLRQCFENGTRTFGFVCTSHVKPGDYGTTAQIRNYTVDHDGNMKCIVEGSQRFKIVSSERAGPLSSLYGLVLVLPDLILGSPYGSHCSLSRLSISRKRDQINRLRGLKYSTWIYKCYDAEELVKRIRDHLRHWLIVHEDAPIKQEDSVQPETSEVAISRRKHKQSSSKPGSRISAESQNEQDNSNRNQILMDPQSFSYWVAVNLPVDLEDRAKALTFNCAEARLLWELSILQKRLDLCCSNCSTQICSRDNAFSMCKSGPQSSFVNRSGHIHDTFTVLRVRNLTYSQHHWIEQYSWFPGYAWRICNCNTCNKHIGWCFKTTDKSLKPEKFYGLSRQNIRLK